MRKARHAPRSWAGPRSSGSPLLLVDAEAEGGAKASLILQNAETIRLVAPGGNAISVVNLAAGDKILGCVLEGGRHFGMAVKETIREK